MGDQAIEYNNGNNANDINDNDDDDDGDDHQQYLHHPPPSSSSSTLWESPPKLKQSPMTTYPIALEESPPAYSIPPSLRNKWKTGSPTTTTNWRSQIHLKSNANIAGDNSERSTTGASAEEVIEQTTNDQEPHRQQYPAISEEEDVIIDNDDDDNNDNNILLLQKFWRTYDTLIILSICSIIGIVFRMLSAKWFRLEMGSVFSEDSALGTNLPLNVWSCFLMGLLCSGR